MRRRHGGLQKGDMEKLRDMETSVELAPFSEANSTDVFKVLLAPSNKVAL